MLSGALLGHWSASRTLRRQGKKRPRFDALDAPLHPATAELRVGHGDRQKGPQYTAQALTERRGNEVRKSTPTPGRVSGESTIRTP
jgi:hypothetical protein